MPIYRATVCHTSSAVDAVDGYSPTRRIYELSADNQLAFKAQIMDFWLSDVDALVEFGPITTKEENESK